MAVVHGFRTYTIHHLPDTLRCLSGGRAVHVNSAISPPAVCDGFDSTAEWLTDEVRWWDGERHPNEAPAPQYLCTCGYYGHRLWPEGPTTGRYYTKTTIFAHVTTVGRTILHSEGWRAEAVRIDYIIPPRHILVPMGAYDGVTHDYEEVWLDDVVTGIAARLGVPVLPFDHEKACTECVKQGLIHGRIPSWPEASLSGMIEAQKEEQAPDE